jgi:hypothetical protein
MRVDHVVNADDLNKLLDDVEGSLQLDRTYIRQQRRLLEELQRLHEPVSQAQQTLQKLENLERRHIERRDAIRQRLSKQ